MPTPLKLGVWGAGCVSVAVTEHHALGVRFSCSWGWRSKGQGSRPVSPEASPGPAGSTWPAPRPSGCRSPFSQGSCCVAWGPPRGLASPQLPLRVSAPGQTHPSWGRTTRTRGDGTRPVTGPEVGLRKLPADPHRHPGAAVWEQCQALPFPRGRGGRAVCLCGSWRE